MRKLTLLLLFCTPVFGWAQDNTYGKTETQILAMGLDKWDDYYAKRAGTSTADMSAMNEIFGTAALHRNQKLERQAKATTRSKVEKLRKLLADFAGNAVDLGYNVDGGGTIWTPVSASIAAHTELVLYPLLGGSGAKATNVSVSVVKKELGVLEKTIASEHNDKSADAYFKFGEAKASLAKMRAELSEIALAAKKLDRANSDRVMGFCSDYAKLAKGDWS